MYGGESQTLGLKMTTAPASTESVTITLTSSIDTVVKVGTGSFTFTSATFQAAQLFALNAQPITGTSTAELTVVLTSTAGGNIPDNLRFVLTQATVKALLRVDVVPLGVPAVVGGSGVAVTLTLQDVAPGAMSVMIATSASHGVTMKSADKLTTYTNGVTFAAGALKGTVAQVYLTLDSGAPTAGVVGLGLNITSSVFPSNNLVLSGMASVSLVDAEAIFVLNGFL